MTGLIASMASANRLPDMLKPIFVVADLRFEFCFKSRQMALHAIAVVIFATYGAWNVQQTRDIDQLPFRIFLQKETGTRFVVECNDKLINLFFVVEIPGVLDIDNDRIK